MWGVRVCVCVCVCVSVCECVFECVMRREGGGGGEGGGGAGGAAGAEAADSRLEGLADLAQGRREKAEAEPWRRTAYNSTSGVGVVEGDHATVVW